MSRKVLSLRYFVMTALLCHMTLLFPSPTRVLTDRTVTAILHDRYGMAWLATSDGLFCYNGYQTMRIADHAERGRAGVAAIVELPSGSTGARRLQGSEIVAATDSGIWCVDFERLAMERLWPEVSHATCMLALGDTLLYIGSSDGLWKVALTGNARPQLIPLAHKRIDRDNAVTAMTADATGTLWLATATNHIVRLDAHESEPRFTSVSAMSSEACITTLLASSEQLYIGTSNNGLWRMPLHETATARQYTPVPAGAIVRSVTVEAGSLYVGTDGMGAYIIDEATGIVRAHYVYRQPTFSSTPSAPVLTGRDISREAASNAVYCVHPDASTHTLWLGYAFGGAECLPQDAPLFQPVYVGDIDTQRLQVRSFHVAADGEMLVGTPYGLYVSDTRRGLQQYYSPETLGASIVGSIVTFGGRHVAACYDCGLITIDPQTMEARNLVEEGKLPRVNLGAMVTTPDGQYLLVGAQGRLFIINNHFELVRQLDCYNSALPDAFISALHIDATGQLWIGTTRGLATFDPRENIVHAADLPPDFPRDVPNLIFSESLGGNILAIGWNGVWECATDLSECRRIDIFERFRLGSINALLPQPAMRGYVVTTDCGLFLLNEQWGALSQRSETDGLPCLNFNRNGIIITEQDSTIWLSTQGGVVKLTASSWQHFTRELPGRVCLARIMMNGRTDDKAMFSCRDTTLNVQWNFRSTPLKLHPLLMDFRQPNHRFFEWKVDDGEWLPSGAGDCILVTRLSLGTHLLRLRVVGHPETTSIYRLRVRPSLQWWLQIATTFFLIMVLVALVFGAQWLVRVTKRRLVERQRLHEAQQREAVQTAREQRVQDKSEEYARLYLAAVEHLEQTRAYTNRELRLSDVARAIGTNATSLSQALNDYAHISFFDFINTYRLAEFKRLMAQPDSERYTMLSLSEQAGFKRSSFFATFKKVEGCTPTEYFKVKSDE